MRIPVGITAISFSLLTMSFGALANTPNVLRQVNVVSENQVEFLFDGLVDRNKIQTEFVRDIFQISLKDMSIYPAKILSVDGKDLKKVFAYQYTPGVVRCRLTLADSNESLKNRVAVDYRGKIVVVKIEPLAAQAEPAILEKPLDDPGEKTLMDRIVKTASVSEQAVEKTQKLGGGPSESSFGRMVLSLFIVLLIFIVLATGVRRWLRSRSTGEKISNSAISDFISRFAPRGTGNRKTPIEIVATQFIAPKKSIMVVRVYEKTIVLGLGGETIQYLTDLPSQSFSATLEKESEEENTDTGFGSSQENTGIRERIRKRMEGMKSI